MLASTYDLKIVGNSGGSLASTSLTKAKGWAKGLAAEWGMTYDTDYKYNPTLDTVKCSDEKNDEIKLHTTPSLKSMLESCLPSFLFVCLTLRFMSWWFPENESIEGSCTALVIEHEQPAKVLEYALRHIVLGTTCCILAATSKDSTTDGDKSTILLASALAGVITSSSASLASRLTSSGGGSALAGLLAGAYIPPIMNATSSFCVRWHVTATMTNILLAGGVGTVTGLFMHLSGLSCALGAFSGVLRCLLQWRKLDVGDDSPWPMQSALATIEYVQHNWIDAATSVQYSKFFHISPYGNEQFLPVPYGVGFICGCIFVYGSKIGWYHSIFLPLILVEMDGTAYPSLLGAMDECTLVMVCAGICAGNLIVPPESTGEGTGHKSLSWQALKTNIFCGDFIEAAYPYMEKSKLINFSAYVAAGLSSELLLQRRVLGSAYLPLPMIIWLSNDRLGMWMSCATAFVVCLIGTLLSNLL